MSGDMGLTLSLARKARIDWINDVAWTIRRTAPSKSIRAVRLTYAISTRFDYGRGLAEAQIVLGVHSGYEGALADALRCYEEARSYLERENVPKALARVYNSTGFLYITTGRYDKALLFLTKSVKLSRQIGQMDTAILSLYNLSEIDKELEKFEDALSLLDEAEMYCLKSESTYLPQILASKAVCYMRLGQDDASELYIQKAFESEAKCIDPMTQKQCRHIIAKLLFDRGDFKAVISVTMASIEAHQSYVHTYGLINDYLLLAKAHFALGNLTSARDCALKALYNTHQLKLDYFSANIHQLMSEISAAEGDYRESFRLAQLVIEDNEKKHSTALENQIAIMAIEMKTDRLKQETEIHRLKNIELKAKGDELAMTIQKLQETQAELVRQEKMAALGNLIAGLAHEINTPYGVIQAAVQNIAVYAEKLLVEDYPKLLEALNHENRQSFFKLLNRAMEKRVIMSSVQERAGKRALEAQLEAVGIVLARRDIEDLCDMRLFSLDEEMLTFLYKTHDLEVIKTLHQLSGIMRNLTNAQISVNKASKVIFALRDYAHFNHSLERTRFRLEGTIMTALQLYENSIKQQVELKLRIDSGIVLWGYPDELIQVWMNLIQNALQAMAYKGSLTIHASSQDGHAVVMIEDTGEGIDPAIADRVFEPFFTTRGRGLGSGMGLDLVKRIVQKHQGDVNFESKEKGTRFYVTLPLELTDGNL